MRRSLLIVWLAAACTLQAATVKVHGYITAVKSPANFEIDDYKIVRDAKTTLEPGDAQTIQPEDLRTGIEVVVQGSFNDSTHELHADCIKVFVNDSLQVKRFAVVEHSAALERKGNSFQGVIRTDGQTIRVDDDTKVHIHVADDIWKDTQINPGATIEYEGTLNRDGTIHATRLEMFQSGRHEHSPGKDAEAKVNTDGELFVRGVKYKLAPDAEGQSYVQRIGAALVPAYYKRDLTGGAARKDPFEFYLVEDDEFNVHAFPNGTVLVNSGVFKVLHSEGQLAAVLGHEIAHATQEHSLREADYRKQKIDGPILENQADRLALEYMVAAGYDPREAPDVWKQLAHRGGHKGSYWTGQDDTTLRRSYLLAELNNNYAKTDFKAYIRDTDDFDQLAQRFGNTAITLRPSRTQPIEEAQVNRPGYRPPTLPQARNFGPNSVNITSAPEGADVLLNGMLIGKTPMILPTTNPGVPYTLTIQLRGYMPWTGQMVVVPGKTNLQVDLFSMR